MIRNNQYRKCELTMSKVRYKMISMGILFFLLASINLSSTEMTFRKGDVHFESKDDFYTISFEENKENLVLFKIEGANGAVNLEADGCPDLKYNSVLNETMLFLTKSLDYDEKKCREDNNYIRDGVGDVTGFKIKLLNVDDNAPQFKLSSSSCGFKENTDYPLEESKCEINMYDLDGMMDNVALTLKEGDSTIFGVDFNPKPNDDDKNAKLYVYIKKGIQLDYETVTSYILVIHAQETVNSGEVQIAITVIDQPDQPPKFTKMISTEQFEENIDQTFHVTAIDGDTGINSTISYKIRKNGCEKKGCTITISESGEISVKNVDREVAGDTILLTIAAVEEDLNSTSLDITFVIQDQDDNVPTITMDPSVVEINEGYKGTITKFTVVDMDLSENGTFSISMVIGGGHVDYTKAFELIPDSGYQSAKFIVTVVNSTLLDYEDDDWKVIKFNITATEKQDKSHVNSTQLTINLKDINDEPPIFVDKTDSVNIPEDVEAGATIFNAVAYDKDAGDTVTYEIVGIWKQKLDIDTNGLITTKVDNTFDYEVIQQVLISIQAADNDRTHVTTKVLTINVIDVDDEPPVMRVDIETDEKMAIIDENSASGTEIKKVSIVVTDPDTKPKLKVEIDWKDTYVTKNSRKIDLPENEYQCFSVKPGSQPNDQTLEAKLMIGDKCSPDFEKFDAIQLFLIATDLNTKKRADSTKGSVLINIGDINDNHPYFIDSSLKGLTVTDGNQGGTKIGTITARDDDIGDDLFFSIEPAKGEPDWVTIDTKSGELSVIKDATIDCDIPRRDNLSYYITVHDPDPTHNNKTRIFIRIDDINDQTPQIISDKTEVHLKEQSANGTEVIKFSAEDKDRDDEFRKVVFGFDLNIGNEAADRFSIDKTSGLVVVNLKNGAVLDRDEGPASFVLPIVVHDNPKGTPQLKNNFDLKVILDDIDNHVPILNTKSLESSENLKKDEKVGEIDAYDPDEDGANSNVYFTLKDVIPLDQDNKKILDSTFFNLKKDSDKKASIYLLKSFEEYWGNYNLTIETYDQGNPEKTAENIITLTVDKFNFKQPRFLFPKSESEKKITIDKDMTNPKQPIILPNGNKLNNLIVDDQQDHKWNVQFSIIEGNGADLFRVIKAQDTDYEGILQITKTDGEINKLYEVTVRASVKSDMKSGEESISADTKLEIKFFSNTEQPKFDEPNATLQIEENTKVDFSLPFNASFSDVDINNIQPYYFIYPSQVMFRMNSTTGYTISDQEFDYETKNMYELEVVAMNKNFSPQVPPNDKDSNVLHLTINVIDMNDHKPVFNPSKFTGALLKNSKKGETILTVNATDADPTLNKLTFSLKNFSCSESLKSYQNPFEIKSDGEITNTFTVTSDMTGYCEFYVEVKDQEDQNHIQNTESTTVLVNIISSNELVKFTFLNEDWIIHQKQDQITNRIDEVFEQFKYKSYLADLTYDKSWHNSTAHFYFMSETSQPVPAKEILGNLTDPTKYAKLTSSLEGIEVHLYYFSQENSNKISDDYLKIWLIVTTIILASLLSLMSIIFFFRNRALTRRINNLSTTKFGSQDSGLNRAGVTAPTTNKNAIEGSNPVFNLDSYIKEVEDDGNSVHSGDSDLIGVENNPDFDF